MRIVKRLLTRFALGALVGAVFGSIFMFEREDRMVRFAGQTVTLWQFIYANGIIGAVVSLMYLKPEKKKDDTGKNPDGAHQ